MGENSKTASSPLFEVVKKIGDLLLSKCPKIQDWLVVSTHLKNINLNQSNWIISPGRDENKKYLKPPSRGVLTWVAYL